MVRIAIQRISAKKRLIVAALALVVLYLVVSTNILPFSALGEIQTGTAMYIHVDAPVTVKAREKFEVEVALFDQTGGRITGRQYANGFGGIYISADGIMSADGYVPQFQVDKTGFSEMKDAQGNGIGVYKIPVTVEAWPGETQTDFYRIKVTYAGGGVGSADGAISPAYKITDAVTINRDSAAVPGRVRYAVAEPDKVTLTAPELKPDNEPPPPMVNIVRYRVKLVGQAPVDETVGRTITGRAEETHKQNWLLPTVTDNTGANMRAVLGTITEEEVTVRGKPTKTGIYDVEIQIETTVDAAGRKAVVSFGYTENGIVMPLGSTVNFTNQGSTEAAVPNMCFANPYIINPPKTPTVSDLDLPGLENDSENVTHWTNGQAAVRLEAFAENSATDINVNAAEFFIDTVGAEGTGTPIMLPVGGAWNSPYIWVYVDIPVLTLQGLSEGSHDIYVRASEFPSPHGPSYWGPVSTQQLKLFIDRTPPSVTVTKPSVNEFVSGDSYQVLGSAINTPGSGGSSPINTVQIYEQGQLMWMDAQNDVSRGGVNFSAWVYQSSNQWNTTLIPDGSYALRARAVDVAGNIGEEATVNVNVDNTAPSLYIISPTNKQGFTAESIPITATVTGTGTYTLEWGEGVAPTAWTTLGTGASPKINQLLATWDVSGLADGTYTIRLSGVDEYNNTGSTSIKIYIDHLDPSSAITEPADGSWARSSVTISGTADDATSGVSEVKVRLKRSSDGYCWNGSTWQNNDNTWVASTITSGQGTPTALWQYTWIISGVSHDETVTVTSKATDVTTNEETPGTGRTIRVDTTAPTINWGGATPSQWYTSAQEITVSVSDLYSGPAGFRWNWNTDPGDLLSVNVGNWHLNEGTGSTTADASIYLNRGTMHGTSYWTNSGISGHAFYGSGDDYITVANSASLNSGSFSVEMWVRSSTLRVQGLASKQSGSNGWRLFMANTSGNIEFDAYGGVANIQTPATNTGTWHHVIATYDSASQTAKIYLNGTFSQQATSVNMQNTYANPLEFSSNITRRFYGRLDEIKYYNRALSADEVVRRYIEGASLIDVTGASTGTTTFPSEGKHTLYVWAYNNAGNSVAGDNEYWYDPTAPGGWANFTRTYSTQTPNASIKVSDATSGLNVNTGSSQYSYSTDGGTTWSAWTNASVTGTNGTTDVQTITATAIPFPAQSDTLNYVKFRIWDVAGNGHNTGQQSPAYLVDNEIPAVTSIYPAAAAANVEVDTVVKVNFSEKLFSSSLTTDTFKLYNTTDDPGMTLPLGGSVTYFEKSSSSVLGFFDPTALLEWGHTYTVVITTGVRDVVGNYMTTQYSSSFTTAAVEAALTSPSIGQPVKDSAAYTLATANQTLTADRILAGTVNIALGSTLKTGTILKAGTTATSSADKIALGGTWTGSGPYTLTTASQTLTADRILAGTVNVAVDSTLKTGTILKAGTTATAFADKIALGGTWTGIGVDIQGTARGNANYKEYSLTYGAGASPASWTAIGTNPRTGQVNNATLGTWNVSALADGVYTIRLQVSDTGTTVLERRVTVRVDNTGPTAAVTLPAEGSTIYGIYNSTGTGADTPSGVAKVEIQVDAGSWVEVTGNNRTEETGPAVVFVAAGAAVPYTLAADWTLPVSVTLTNNDLTTVVVDSRLADNTVLRAGTIATSLADRTAIGGTWTGTGPYTLTYTRTLTANRTLVGIVYVAHNSQLHHGTILKAGTITTSLADKTALGGTWTGGPSPVAWTNSNDASASGGALKFHTDATASATFSFTGTAVTFISTRAPDRGYAKIYIDGTKITDGTVALSGDTGGDKSGLDLFSADTRYQERVYTKSGLTSGAHTIKVEVVEDMNPLSRGTRVDVDAFEIGGSVNWTYSLDTTSLSFTSHTIRARATDRAGLLGDPCVYRTFIVSAIPTALIKSPVANDLVGDSVTITGIATGAPNFLKYDLYYGAGSSPTSWYNINTLEAAGGSTLKSGTTLKVGTIAASEEDKTSIGGTTWTGGAASGSGPYVLTALRTTTAARVLDNPGLTTIVVSSRLASGTRLNAGTTVGLEEDKIAIGGTAWIGGVYTLSSTRTLSGNKTVTNPELTTVVARSVFLTSTVLNAGTMVTSLADKTAIGGDWAGTGPYTLTANKTLTANRTLSGTCYVSTGSILWSGSSLRAGTTTSSITDKTNFGGTWSAVGPFTLTANRTISSTRVLEGTIYVTTGSSLASSTRLRAGTTTNSATDKTALGGTWTDAWTGTGPYTLAANLTFTANKYNTALTTVIAGSSIQSGTRLKAGATTEDAADRTALGGTWGLIGGVYTLRIDRTTAATRVLTGTLKVERGSRFASSTRLNAGTTTTSELDRIVFGGSWTRTPYTLTTTDRTLSGDVVLGSSVYVTYGSTLKSGTVLHAGTKTTSEADKNNIGGDWTGSGPYTLSADWTLTGDIILTSPGLTPVNDGTLGTWITSDLLESGYSIKLVVTDTDLTTKSSTVYPMIVDHTIPYVEIASPMNMDYVDVAFTITGTARDYVSNGIMSDISVPASPDRNQIKVYLIKGVDSFVPEYVDLGAVDTLVWNATTDKWDWTKDVARPSDEDWGWFSLQARAKDRAQNEKGSNYVYNCIDETAPPAPKVRGVPDHARGFMSLSWTPVKDVGGGVDYYEVWRDGAIMTSDLQYYDGVNINTVDEGGRFYASNALDTSIVAGQSVTHNYKVRAIDYRSQASEWSNTVTLRYDGEAPTAPSGLVASTAGSTNSIYLEWTASTDDLSVTEYKIYRTTDPTDIPSSNPNYLIATTPTTSVYAVPRFFDGNLVAGEHYRYQIVAYDEQLNMSAASNIDEGIAGANPSYDSPHGTFATDSDTCVICHRTHTARGEGLVREQTATKVCYSCHDGTGSSNATKQQFDYAPSTGHRVKGDPGTMWENGMLTCVDCHSPHANPDCASFDDFENDLGVSYGLGVTQDGWTAKAGLWSGDGNSMAAALTQGTSGDVISYIIKDTGLTVDSKGGKYAVKVKFPSASGHAFFTIGTSAVAAARSGVTVDLDAQNGTMSLMDGDSVIRSQTGISLNITDYWYRIRIKIGANKDAAVNLYRVIDDNNETKIAGFTATVPPGWVKSPDTYIAVGTENALAQFDNVKVNDVGMLMSRYRAYSGSLGGTWTGSEPGPYTLSFNRTLNRDVILTGIVNAIAESMFKSGTTLKAGTTATSPTDRTNIDGIWSGDTLAADKTLTSNVTLTGIVNAVVNSTFKSGTTLKAGTTATSLTDIGSQDYLVSEDKLAGEEFCLACHGNASDSPGGSQRQYYTSAHNQLIGSTTTQPGTITPRWMTLREKWKEIKQGPLAGELKGTNNGCLYCHGYHGQQLYEQVASGEEELCYRCHGRDANYSRTGANVYQQYQKAYKHGLTVREASIKCTSCHGQRGISDRFSWEGYSTSMIVNPANIKQSWSEMRMEGATVDDYCNACHREDNLPVEKHTSTVIVPYTIKYPPMYTTPSANGFVRSGYSATDKDDNYVVGHKIWTTTGNCAAGLNYDGTGCHSAIQAKYPEIDISQVPEYTNRIACTACHHQHASDYPRLVRLPEDSKGDLIVLVGEVNMALGSTFRTGAILKAGTTATSNFDKTYIGGTWTGSGLYTLTANRTLAANRILDNTKLTTVVAGSSIRASTILKVGTIAASVTDTTNLGGTWTGTGPYTLSADRTVSTTRTLVGTLYVKSGSTLYSATILNTGTITDSAADTTAIGGTWAGGSGLYTLTADRTLAGNVTSADAVNVPIGSSIKGVLKAGTTATSVEDKTRIGGTWTGTGPYTLEADWTLAAVVNEGMCLHCHNGSITQ